MISKTTPQFWQRFAALPPEIRQLAEKSYAAWKIDPGHGSLHFKKLEGNEALWSVRIGRQYRELARRRAISWCGSGSAITRSMIA